MCNITSDGKKNVKNKEGHTHLDIPQDSENELNIGLLAACSKRE